LDYQGLQELFFHQGHLQDWFEEETGKWIDWSGCLEMEMGIDKSFARSFLQ
jgi:hypothetical protein